MAQRDRSQSGARRSGGGNASKQTSQTNDMQNKNRKRKRGLSRELHVREPHENCLVGTTSSTRVNGTGIQHHHKDYDNVVATIQVDGTGGGDGDGGGGGISCLVAMMFCWRCATYLVFDVSISLLLLLLKMFDAHLFDRLSDSTSGFSTSKVVSRNGSITISRLYKLSAV